MIDRQRVWAVVRKDWLEVARNKQVLSSVIVVPVVFALLIPAAIILLGENDVLMSSVNGLQSFLDNLPAGLVPADFTVAQTMVYAVTVYFLAPFFLLIPVMVASVTASSSLVGEKERHTLEGLLYTPLTNRELALAKVIGSMIPAVALTWASFVVYALVVGLLGSRVIGALYFPTWTWIAMIVILVPLVSFLATSLIVAVSSRSTTMQGAQGTSMLIVFPILGLVIGQATGLMLFDVTVVLLAGLVLGAVDLAAFLLIVARFDREQMITRL